MTDRLARIVAQGRAVLAQIEQDPSDLRRARRFLVTYLDGTRDVVRKYGQQQQDLADTELAANFRHVLETVERVFAEQEEVLKRNETMDLGGADRGPAHPAGARGRRLKSSRVARHRQEVSS